MKKIYTFLIAFLVFAGTATAQIASWNISDPAFNALGDVATTTTVEGLTIYSEGNVTVDANNKSLDGVDYTHRLKLGGSGNFDEGGLPVSRVLAFDVTGNVSITIMCMSSSGSADRLLNVAAGGSAEENLLGAADALGASLTATTFQYTGDATTIYLWSPSSGVNIYNIVVEEPVVPTVVGFFAKEKAMFETAATIAEDPLLELLKADPNFTVVENILTSVAATDEHDLSAYDVLVVQESFGSGDGILTPDGALGLAKLNKPVLYNKSYAFKSGRALADGSAATGSEAPGLNITVDPANQANDLFKGITFDANNEAQLFLAPTNDDGDANAANSVKALNYAREVSISTESTLLAVPTNVTEGHVVSICINDIPEGTVVGGETLAARMVTVGYNTGAILANGGRNMTQEGLTILRNAMYVLAGKEVPAELAEYATTTSIGFEPRILDIYTSNGSVVINDCEGKNVEVYSISGTKVFGQAATSSVVTVPVPSGIYIVVVDNAASKVIVK
ncbi:DUF6383 domain-containing protein [Geofilum rubicundum]|uniref:DUF6383 domain-containing protein n=1 Tax=Geofilum rubicundum JCM 15548 TaxID=1236989 RepID=A0A0E9M2K7_9BACT|nr:DUF6383 domain-containing protein [Geofilum rubicundum]GAO31616.1 hypothetical protein JCM15548_13996 [Geofilum rubicundum JCM 15548]